MRRHSIATFAVLIGTGLCAQGALGVPVAGRGTWASTLQARDLDGNAGNGPEAWYDTVLDITWLADARAGAGSRFDSGNRSSVTDGMMTWANANAWAASLDVGGVTGWRMPVVRPVDGRAFQYYYPTDDFSGRRDVSYNIVATQSELAHLFHVTLGNRSFVDVTGRRQSGPGLANTGPFVHMDPLGHYWTGTGVATPEAPASAWSFWVYDGYQSHAPRVNEWYAWAVHSGDVATTVPEPGTWASMLAGLAVIALLRGRMRRRIVGGI